MPESSGKAYGSDLVRQAPHLMHKIKAKCEVYGGEGGEGGMGYRTLSGITIRRVVFLAGRVIKCCEQPGGGTYTYPSGMLPVYGAPKACWT